MEINLHGCSSIEMEEKNFENFSVITVTIGRENKEEVELQLFHAKDKDILFNFVDNFQTKTSKSVEGEVILFKPSIAWKEVV